MKISVVFNTARLGGFDMLRHSMQAQTMSPDDWELIVVDEFYFERRGLIGLISENGHRFTRHFSHLPPKTNGPLYHNSSNFNVGLKCAGGELVLFLIDFTWLYPAWLEDHWAFYKDHPGCSMSGYVDRYPYPHFKSEPLNAENAGWSIFKQVFDRDFARKWFSENEPFYRERKGGAAGPKIDGTDVNEMPGELVYMLNDSIPLEVLREINGWDQRYDGGYGSNDIDLACRANRAGWKFGLNSASVIQKLGDKSTAHRLPTVETKFLREPEDNYKFFKGRLEEMANGGSPAVPEGFGAWR